MMDPVSAVETTCAGVDGSESSGNLLLNKWLCALFLVAIDAIGVAIPFILGRSKKISDTPILGVFNAFGLGAMLSLGFIHLLAEASEAFEPSTIVFHGEEIKVNFLWFYFVGVILLLITMDKISLIARECGFGSSSTISKSTGCCQSPILYDIAARESGNNDEDGSDDSNDDSNDDKKLKPKKTGVTASLIVLTISLTIHSMVEGLIVGFGTTVLSSWMITLVLAGHKWIEGIVIATELVNAKGRLIKIIPSAAFIIASPIGVVVGAYVHDTANWLGRWVLLISSSSIIYVSFTEVVQSTFEVPKWIIWKCLAALCGAALVAYLTLHEIRATALYDLPCCA